MVETFFEIKFKGIDELLKMAERKAKLLDVNVRAAVARTVLWGAARIAEDTPVDTGRLRSSILGYLAEKHGISVEGDPVEIAKGKSESVTEINGYEGRIGTNVNYAAHVEYGHKATGPKKLTRKQLRYLFASGILTNDSKGNVVPGTVTQLKWKKGNIAGHRTQIGIHAKINRRAGITGRVKGKGMLRKNIPLIDNYFQEQMREAIRYTEQDKLMPVTF